jgi:hypothetical protein
MAILTQSPPTVKTSNPLKRSLEIVRADLAAYLWLNGLYYGLVILGMAYVMFFNPALQQQLLDQIGQAFTTGPLSAVGDAYGGGQVFTAMLLTFVVNLILGSFIEINLLGLIVPFSGLLMGLYRALLWGLLLAPSEPGLAGAMVPHSLTLLIEGQAYVLAMLAVYVQGKAFLRPQTYGLADHARGYVEGLRRTGWIYLLVTLLLAVAAVYEALEVIFLAPLFA